MKTALFGNFDLTQLAQSLDIISPENEIILGSPGNFLAELSGPLDLRQAHKDDLANVNFCILALDWQFIVPDVYSYSIGGNFHDIVKTFTAELDRIHSAIKTFREWAPGSTILIFTPVSGYLPGTPFLERRIPQSSFELFAQIQTLFNESCRSIPDLFPVDIDEISSRIGKEQSFDFEALYREESIFTSQIIKSISLHIYSLMQQLMSSPVKCIVCDLDNTLWSGVVGEVGPDGIVLNDRGPGRAYKDFQRELLRLHKQGMIIAICSKNNTCDALEIIETHPHMLIRPSTISCFRINWDDKAHNLVQIAAELNIGLESLLFIDDSITEREAIRAALPDVSILDLPENPVLYSATIRRCSRLWQTAVTSDDLQKGQFYSQENSRIHARELAANLGAFLHKSEIHCRIAHADHESLPRIVQLFTKTNQFNLTTIRHSQSQLDSMLVHDNVFLYYMEMSDIFGDYGTVAAALTIENRIESFVLSCRAFGKKAEFAFLSYLLEQIRSRGYENAIGVFTQSPKNSMTKTFYKEAGFRCKEETGEKTIWELQLDGTVFFSPPWIKIDV